MAKVTGAVKQSGTVADGSGVNPDVIKFLIAAVVATAAVSLLEQASRGAAALLAFVIILLLFVTNSPLIGAINAGSRALQNGMR